MATKYEIKMKPSEIDFQNFCIYQTYDHQMDDIRPLAWFSKAIHPDKKPSFEWNIDFNIAWSEQGDPRPGLVFLASQIADANPSDTEK